MSVVPGFYQWVCLTPETTYGVFNSGGTAVWIRIEGDDGFTPKKVPARTIIRSADAYNRRIQNISSRYAVSAGMKTPFYPTQAATMLGAAATLAGVNLGSFTADYWDGQVIRRYLGGMVQSLDLSSSSDSQYADLSLQWIFQAVDDAHPTTLPAPAETLFPSESPYLHTELASQFTVGGTGITQFDQFRLSIRNQLTAKFYESPTIAFCQWAGRDVDLSSHLTYVDTTWRGYYEAQTALTLVATYYRSATKKCQLSFETVSILSDRDVSRPLGGVMEQGISAQAFYDVANTNDFSFTALYS